MKTTHISKTTKQNINYLQGILSDLLRVERFILSDRIVVTHISRGTATNEYHCPNSAAWDMPAFVAPITKEIGSDLCMLYNARKKLMRFLEQCQKPEL